MSTRLSVEDYWSKKHVTTGMPSSRRCIVILTERWDLHRDAQHARDRLTIKDLRNDALSVCELRVGVSRTPVAPVRCIETCGVTRNMGLRLMHIAACRV